MRLSAMAFAAAALSACTTTPPAATTAQAQPLPPMPLNVAMTEVFDGQALRVILSGPWLLYTSDAADE